MPIKGWVADALEPAQGSASSGPLLQSINLQMARDEYELNGQQGLDQLLAVLGGEEVQVMPWQRVGQSEAWKLCCSVACHWHCSGGQAR